MLGEEKLDIRRSACGLRSPGFLYCGMWSWMGLIHLLLVDKGDHPIVGFIAPDVPFSVAAAGAGNPTGRRQMPFGPLSADGHVSLQPCIAQGDVIG